MQKPIIFVVLFLWIIMPVRAATQAKHNLEAELPKTICIENVYVDGIKVDTSLPKIDFQIKAVIPNASYNLLELSPITLDIFSNAGDVVINGDFTELQNSAYSFDKTKLNLHPQSVITDPEVSAMHNFIPQIKVDSNVIPGIYRGQIIFTVGEA